MEVRDLLTAHAPLIFSVTETNLRPQDAHRCEIKNMFPGYKLISSAHHWSQVCSALCWCGQFSVIACCSTMIMEGSLLTVVFNWSGEIDSTRRVHSSSAYASKNMCIAWFDTFKWKLQQTFLAVNMSKTI